MRILWHSNSPWAATGYGNQTKLTTPRLRDLGHDVGISAFYGMEGGVITWEGMPVFPKGQHGYGLDIVGAHASTHKADVLISLIDAWVIDPQRFPRTRWVPWFPVDMDPLPPPVAEKIRQAYARLVYSRHGERSVHEAGMDCIYIPHGVDTQQFSPGSQREARERLRLPQDAFIVGMVAANKGTPSRKALPQHLEAFSQLRRQHSDARLYLHTTADERQSGVNLPELCAILGLTSGVLGTGDFDVYFCDQYRNSLGFPDAYMVEVYRAIDVLASVSMGEGFGIPILEAQACGTPVITGDWTAMSELTFGGWKVLKPSAERWYTPLAAWQYVPHTTAIYERLNAAYKAKGGESMKQRQHAARKGALGYDVDRVAAEYWAPALAELEQRIAGEAAPKVHALPPVELGSVQPEDVTLVIPVYGNQHLLDQLLASVDERHPRIIVDDASPEPILGATVRLAENGGYAKACNFGLSMVQTPYVCFLNSDIVAYNRDWWRPLVNELADYDGVGAATPLLLYPDGRVQYAGIEFVNGLPQHRLRFAPGDHPEALKRRDNEPAFTAAVLMMRTELARQVEGFDEDYRGGTYEDTDLALRLRWVGYRLVYQPASILRHYEAASMSQRRELTTWFITNQRIFLERWRDLISPEGEIIAFRYAEQEEETHAH